MRKIIGIVLLAAVVTILSGCSLTDPYAVDAGGEKVMTPFQILADGEPVAFVSSEEEGKEIIKKLKTYYGKGGKIQEKMTVEPAVFRGHPLIYLPDDTVEIIMTGDEVRTIYTVQKKDTITSISRELGVLAEDLLEWNDLPDKECMLKPGRELTIYVRQPKVHVETKKEISYTEEIRCGVEYVETDTLFKGEKELKSEGVPGEQKVRAELTYVNGEKVSKKVLSRKTVREPVKKVMYKGTRDTGKDVVKYAKRFLGNPYVLGGRDLENGIDCSGFTSAVYAHFGYTIPAYSEDQLSCGIPVEFEDLEPGDLIIYEGHVAMYEGKGKIIHARNEYAGITESEADYRPIKGIRRIIY